MEDKNLEKTVTTRPVTPTELAYRDGYVRGKSNSEQQQEYLDEVRSHNQKVREHDSTANGLLIGIILAGIIGAGAGVLYFVSQDQKAPVQSSTPSAGKETKVIEKTTDRVREIVPSSVPAPPKVEINVPNPAAGQQPGAAQPSQAPQSTQPQSTQPQAAEAKPEQTSQPNSQPAPNN